eukprot:gene16099-21819_t
MGRRISILSPTSRATAMQAAAMYSLSDAGPWPDALRRPWRARSIPDGVGDRADCPQTALSCPGERAQICCRVDADELRYLLDRRRPRDGLARRRSQPARDLLSGHRDGAGADAVASRGAVIFPKGVHAMTLLRTILGELIGLFVDDSNLAMLCVALIAIATALAKLVPGAGVAAAVV